MYPKPYFDVLEKPVAQIVERVRPGYFRAQPSAPIGRRLDRRREVTMIEFYLH